MLVVKDAMILIHLTKTSLLKDTCELLENVIIPEKVKKETVDSGKKKDYPDAILIEETIEQDHIKVKEVKEKELVERANKFNIYGGEAKAVALYWETKADLIATDDDNVRKKEQLLDLNIIGTPAILLQLYKSNKIKDTKLENSLNELKEIGWFSNSVLDKIRMEAGI